MACELVNGIVGVCGYSSSGIQKLWLSNKDAITGVTYNAGGEITGVTFSGGTTNLFAIEPALDTCTYTDDIVISGSRRNFLETIVFGLGSIDHDILDTLEDMGLSKLVAFVKTADGSVRAFGVKSTGLRVTVMTEASGTASANDGNISVTISGSATGKASFVEPSYAITLGLV